METLISVDTPSAPLLYCAQYRTRGAPSSGAFGHLSSDLKMSQGKINIAIVGLGFGAEFIPIYQRHPNANMYAVCQRSPEKLEAMADAYGIEKRYTDFN